MVTGLASDEMEPPGFWFVILIAPLVVFWLGLLVTGVGGVFLLKQLFEKTQFTA